ncbi:MAG TPA: hypothetical protein GX008_09830 [Firmicutes bacterium]|nr:hypothetical protein [Bacillota bacterium]
MRGRVALFSIILLAVALTGCISTDQDYASLTVEVSGEGTITPRQGTHKYPAGTLVELEAHPAPGWTFSRWEGEVVDPYAVRTNMAAEKRHRVRAVFVQDAAVLEAPGGLIRWRADGTQVMARPNGTGDIEYIMIHAMSDAAANPTDPYRIERIREIFDEYGVESHYVIDRQGLTYQFVEDALAGRHGGKGSWGGNPRLTNNMNRYAVGIELLGIGTTEEMIPVIGSASNSAIKPRDRGYTEAQYSALEHLVAILQQRYHVPKENIIGHDDYDPARKWDPGVLFDWNRL